MSPPVGWLPAPATELFGPEAVAEESYEVLTVDVPPSAWLTALETARTTLSCTYFDWLSAVDEPGTGFRVAAHVVALHPVRRLLVRTTVPHDAPSLPSAVGVYAGAAWHERETHEMFGVVFEGHPGLQHLLLPENFEGHPLRKDFVLAARVAKAWPGAKEPGEPAAGAAHGAPKRRQMLPPGVPDPNEWGPLKGQLPPAPARPARAAGRAAGDRPVRRTRSAAEGSVGQTAQPTGEAAAGAAAAAAADAGAGAGAGAAADAGAAVRPRRTRSASEGSASQAAARAEDAATRKQGATEADATRAAAQGPTEGPAAEASVAHEPGPAPAPARPRRARSAAEGSATQRTQAAPEPTSTEPAGPAKPAEPTQPAEPAQPAGPAGAARPARRSTAPRSSDAPWHHARPAFTEPEPGPQPGEERAPQPEPQSAEERSPEPEQEPVREPRPAVPEDPDPGTDHPTTDTPSTPDDPAGGPQ